MFSVVQSQQLEIKTHIKVLASSIFLASFVAVGCAFEESRDPAERIHEAPAAQSDVGYLLGRIVRLSFTDQARTPFAEIHIVSRETRIHRPGTEYWYVNRAASSLLGTYALDVTTEDVDADPPDPDYPNEQRFTEVEFPTTGWGAGWTSDPHSFGTLLGDGSGAYLRFATTTTGDVSRVAWYQVIPDAQAPRWLTLDGRFVAGGASASVPSGYRGYDIDQAAP
ncbi:hypothetical protein A7982_13803 [Minicystis rosea]|nr:hypothetical protein A7982_13803 [Minicystis rosea]